MAEEVKMPQMGESIAEGTIVRWLKQVGDTVKRDEPLFEISTDKVDAEIPSPTSGTLLEIKAQEGETVAVNSVVAVIGSGDAKAAAPAPAAEAPAPQAAPPTPPPAPTVAAQPEPAPVAAPPAAPPAPVAAPQAAAAPPQASGGSAGEEVKMPQMGESIAEGTIVRWLKQVGDTVKRDEPLFEISTDKVDAEIPSPTSGTLLEIKAQEGETVAVNSVVAVIGSGDAKAAAPAPAAEAPAPSTPPPAPEAPAPVAAPPAPPAAAPAATQSAEDSRPVKSSPVVRKIAEEHGVDISAITGTGIDGRVTKQDILQFIESGGAAAATASAPTAPAQAAPAQPAAPASSAPKAPASAPAALADKPAVEYGHQPFSDSDRVEITPMSIMRRKIAERMVESKHTSAHVYSLIEVDYTKTAAVREKLKGEYLQRDGVKLTYMPFIIKAVIEGLKKFPIVNSSVWGDQIVYKKDYNIGVAVALDWGLIVPVVRNADEKSLLGIARSVNDLGERARNKKLKPDEVQGGTFTITNPGVFGGLIGLPVINQPQVAILGVGGIKKRPVVVDDAIAIRQIGMLSLSYDHRVVDGADADQFLAFVRDVIEKGEFTS